MLAHSFSSLRNKRIIDTQGQVYGHVGDVVLDSFSLQLRAFVIHGSKLEEALERFKLRKDNDSVLLPSQIERITTEAIFLNTTFQDLNKLEHYLRNSKSQIILFSELKNKRIFDQNGTHIGEIVNLHFPQVHDASQLVEYELGGSTFKDLLNRNHCSLNLTYTITLEDLSFDKLRGYIIHPSVIALQDRIKKNLHNIYRDMLMLALEDGNLVNEEEILLKVVDNRISNYQGHMKQGMHTDGDDLLRIEEFKEETIQELITVAKKDQVISRDERQLILKFCSHLSDHSRELFYAKQLQ